VDISRGIVTAEKVGQPLQLHRFPDRQPRQHDGHAGNQDADIEELLHRVVSRQILMREPATERGEKIAQHVRRPNRDELAAEPTRSKAEDQINEAVEHQDPHRREMPEQRAAEPAAERDVPREGEAEQRRRVVDLPARADHDQHRQRIDPVCHAHPDWVDDFTGSAVCDGHLPLCGFNRAHGRLHSCSRIAHLRVPDLHRTHPAHANVT
jgi:hypothetical protein